MVGEQLLAKYRDKIATGKLVTRDTADERARRGRDRLRHADVPQPDRDRLQPGAGEGPAEELCRARRLGEGRTRRSSATTASRAACPASPSSSAGSTANGGGAEKLEKGPYDAATQGGDRDSALGDLKEFNKNVMITPGNAGTLDMLNRGEIAMGPVWVDMFYTWMADGRLPPEHEARS